MVNPKETKTRKILSRKQFLDLVWLTLGGGAIYGVGKLLKNADPQTQSPTETPIKTPTQTMIPTETSTSSLPTIEFGQSKLLKLLEYENKVQGLIVSIDDSILEERSKDLGFNLRTPNELKVSLLPEVAFAEADVRHSYVNVKSGDPQSKIQIAGQGFIDEVYRAKGKPPSDIQDVVFLSVAHSITLMYGHLQLAVMKGEISQEDARTRSDYYRNAVLNLDPRYTKLPSFININGITLPPNFGAQAILDKKQQAQMRSLFSQKI